jgi:hypothetical protein
MIYEWILGRFKPPDRLQPIANPLGAVPRDRLRCALSHTHIYRARQRQNGLHCAVTHTHPNVQTGTRSGSRP